ncbi:MAG: Thiamine biosynthesis lipoprotein ApbE precursor [Firmicutes bacterium ADurb.BinA205]|nr:MAG: Thiamine biosynthesis lipoprotein ApbE precursor [Firmicutes bacterium ADurb.BinA205]
MSFKYLCISALLISCTGLLCSCSSPLSSSVTESGSDAQNLDVFAMNTYMSMKAYGDNAQKALDDSRELIMRLESELSVTDEGSCIYELNKNGKGTVTDSAAVLINKAIEIGDRTGGALDITLYPVLKEWGFTTEDYHIPDDKILADLLSDVDYKSISISGNEVTLPENVQIDLGALAKGYTSDSIMEQMSVDGVDSAIVSLGGNVQAIGGKPDGSAWKVSVRDPFAPDTDMCIVEIKDKAVITSGNYERFFTGDDGKKYWHIIDPADGYPADNGLVSTTIIGDSGLECDALSTAFFVAGKDKAVDYWRSDRSFDMILVSDDGKIYYTEGIADSFKNISSMEAEVLRLD